MYGKELSAEDKVKRYQTRIMWSLRKYNSWHNNVAIWLDYYRNKPKVWTKGGQRVIVPKGIAAIDAQFASLTAVEVDISVAPKGLTSRTLSRVVEDALQNEWDRAKTVERCEPVIKDALIAGIGWAKIDYDYADEEHEEGEVEVLRDRITVDWVPWDDILWDPEAKRVEDIRWIVQRMELPLEQVQNDERYDPRTRGLVQANSRIREDWRTDTNDEANPDEERVILYRMYDVDTDTVCTFPKDQTLLLEEQSNPYHVFLDNEDKFPYVPLILRSDPGEVVGVSDMRVMKPMLDEINVLRSSLSTYVERFKPKVIAREGTFTESGKRALRSQEWGEVVEAQPNSQVNQDVSPLVPPQLPREAFSLDAQAASDVDESVGNTDLMQGELPQGRKTATGMSMLADATTIRHSEKRNRVERFYKQVARKVLFLMQLFYDEAQITKLVEADSDVVWRWTAEDLIADVQLDIALTPKKNQTPESRKEDIVMLLNVLGTHPMVNQDALLQYTLEEFDLPLEVIRTLIKSAETMQAEQQGQLQMAAAEQQVAEGLPPDPSMIPGPLTGSALSQAANEGEMPV